eukprot:2708579-Pyramimonas_sp.AAC.1
MHWSRLTCLGLPLLYGLGPRCVARSDCFIPPVRVVFLFRYVRCVSPWAAWARGGRGADVR